MTEASPVSERRHAGFDHAINQMLVRIDDTASAEPDGFPHFADPLSGRWTTTPTGDWTGGFWVGELWLAGRYTQKNHYWSDASHWAERLAPRAESATIFRGFLFYYGAVLGALLAQSDRARSIALRGAYQLASSYNRDAGLIPLGAEAEEAHTVGAAETNIDGVSASALLHWAAEETGDAYLAEMGTAHARSHIALCVREDGSVCQSASFDPRNGGLTRRYTHKGYTDSSTWGRAQAWAMLGFAMAAAGAPEAEDLLETAELTADWWIANIPADLIANWDFDAPIDENTKRDTSGTAIAAAALLKLSHIARNEARKRQYWNFASETVEALVGAFLTPRAEGCVDGILTQGCYNYHLGLAPEHELIWGDYFLFESLGVLSGRIGAVDV